MNGNSKSAAYEVLGLAPGASESDVKAAYEKQLAFWSDEGSLNPALKNIAVQMRAKIEQAHKTLSTVGGGVTAGTGAGKDKDKYWWVWLMLIIGGVCYMAAEEERNKHQENPPVIEDNQKQDQQQQQQQEQKQVEKPPESAPDYALPYLHTAVKSDLVKWTTEDLSSPGSTRIGLLGKDSQDRLRNYLIFYKQEMSTRWEFYEQWIIRYSADNTQVSVDHFEYRGQSDAYVYKDERNVSEVGDVLVRTTNYFYHWNGSKWLLDNISCSSPFSENYDGLSYERDSNGNLNYVIRKPGGSPIRLEANKATLPRMFDLWNFFGQYH